MRGMKKVIIILIVICGCSNYSNIKKIDYDLGQNKRVRNIKSEKIQTGNINKGKSQYPLPLNAP